MSATAEEREGVDVTVRVDDVARKIFRADGMLSALLRKMKGMLMAAPERGPSDYSEDDDERRLLLRIIKDQVRRPRDGYQEGGGKILHWILGVLSALAVSSVVGIFVFWGQFNSLRSEVTEWKNAQQRQIDLAQQRIERLENRRP